jgi:hypothetical protein
MLFSLSRPALFGTATSREVFQQNGRVVQSGTTSTDRHVQFSPRETLHCNLQTGVAVPTYGLFVQSLTRQEGDEETTAAVFCSNLALIAPLWLMATSEDSFCCQDSTILGVNNSAHVG